MVTKYEQKGKPKDFTGGDFYKKSRSKKMMGGSSMTETMQSQMKKKMAKSCGSCGGAMGCGYFLGFIGAAVYYISTAGGFWLGVLGFLKALVWPAFLVFELLKYIGA